MGRGMQGPVNLPHAQSCMQTVTICMRMWQAEAAARQEVQSKLAEQQRGADKEKKGLREQLEGKLRAARKEIAHLKSQVQTPCPTPIIHFCRYLLVVDAGLTVRMPASLHRRHCQGACKRVL